MADNKKDMTFSLVILCRNEIDALPHVLPFIDKSWVDEILFIDGASTDGSIEYAQSQGFVVTQQTGKGVMAGYRQGLEMATKDAIILFTPDANCIPDRIPQLTAKMREGYDIVFCSRYKDGAKSYDDSVVSGFGNWMFTRMVNFLFKGNLTDVLGIYRAFRRDLHKRLNIAVKSRPVETRTAIRAIRQGLKIADIPGDEPKRIGGKTCRSIVKNGFNELFIIIEEYFNIPSKYVDSFLKF